MSARWRLEIAAGWGSCRTRTTIRLNARIFYREINDKGKVAGHAG
jgi:predicted metal-dependent hydrolase